MFATDADLMHVLERLREPDRVEMAAATGVDTPEGWMAVLAPFLTLTWCARSEGEPAAMIGVWPESREIWRAFAFGTDRFERVILSLTRHVKRTLVPMVLDMGGEKCIADSIEGHTSAQRWLASLGFRPEGEMPGVGAGGETFIRLVTRREDHG